MFINVKALRLNGTEMFVSPAVVRSSMTDLLIFKNKVTSHFLPKKKHFASCYFSEGWYRQTGQRKQIKAGEFANFFDTCVTEKRNLLLPHAKEKCTFPLQKCGARPPDGRGSQGSRAAARQLSAEQSARHWAILLRLSPRAETLRPWPSARANNTKT